MTTTPGALAAAICAVMNDVGTVAKDGTNSHFGYSFTSEAAILRACRTAMATHGLAMVPAGITGLHSEQFGQKGRFRTEAIVIYRLMHTSGETQDVAVIAAGVDGEDKGPYKAMTGALKYALRQTFLIPTGDDPENETKGGQDNRPPQRQDRPQARQEPRQDRRPQQQRRPQQGGGGNACCPECGGGLYDDRDKRAKAQADKEAGRRSKGAPPAWKCKDKSDCGWHQWESSPTPGMEDPRAGDPQSQDTGYDEGPPPYDDSDVPF